MVTLLLEHWRSDVMSIAQDVNMSRDVVVAS